MTQPKLRKDAAINRDRLLTAGREVFAKRGLDATLNDVAHHAGVGVGTAYRRFANKNELIEAILERQVEEMEEILRDALDHPDPWEGLVMYLERSLAIQSKDRGMAQIFSGRHSDPQQFDWSRDQIAPLVNEIADRARAAGELRSDVTGTDLVFLQVAITSIADTVGDHEVAGRTDLDSLYRRYLWLALDGLRPSRTGVSELPVPPLTTAETHTVMGS